MCFWKTEKRPFVTPAQIHWTAMLNKSRLEGNFALNTVPETNELPKMVRLANTGSNSSKLRPTIPCLVNVHHWTRFLQCCWLLAVRRKLLCQHGNQQMRHQGSTSCEDQITSQKSEMNKLHYYSFKIFLRFWLAKIPRIIHHTQLLSNKFGRILRYEKMTSIVQQIVRLVNR